MSRNSISLPTEKATIALRGKAVRASTPKRDRFLPPIKAETYVFVATNATTDLGYRRDGLEIIVDKDTFRAGQTAPVMMSVPVSDRYVLFSVEGEDLFSYKLVHVTGNAKLIELPIEEKHVPNIYLSALMVSDANWFVDTKQVVVPPVRAVPCGRGEMPIASSINRAKKARCQSPPKMLTVNRFQPRLLSAWLIESVKYIQQDYAGDPRQFYYGHKRAHQCKRRSTFNQKTLRATG